MCCELFWATAFSGDSVENRVYSILLRLAVEVSEVVEEALPCVLSVFFQKLVDSGVFTTGEFGFEKGKFVLWAVDLGSGEGVFDSFDPRFDVAFVEVWKVRLPEGLDVSRLVCECSRNCCLGDYLCLFIAFHSVLVESELDCIRDELPSFFVHPGCCGMRRENELRRRSC